MITIEDPIEFIYTNKKSIIEQREIGSDTPTWHSALRTVLRQRADVIVLGELCDLESISIAPSVAEDRPPGAPGFGPLLHGSGHTHLANDRRFSPFQCPADSSATFADHSA